MDFISLREGIDTSTAAGKLVFTVIAAIAEFERHLIRERVAAGLAKAKEHGTRSGRPIGRPRRHVDVLRARRLHAEGRSWPQVARVLGVSVSTVKRAVRTQC